MDTRTKIIDLASVRNLLNGGGRLAVAGGAFDVLRAGHARRLSALRPEGGQLLVAVWADACLERPTLSERARAQLVAALSAVDYVVVCRPSDLPIDQEMPDDRNIIGVVLERHR